LGDFASKAMYHAFTVVDDAVHAEFGRGWQRLQRPSSAATSICWLSRIQGNASSARKDFRADCGVRAAGDGARQGASRSGTGQRDNRRPAARHGLRVRSPPCRRRRETAANRRAVDPQYFSLMRIPVLAGRTFTPADDEHAPNVAVISEGY
jgi:hypothetical protein